MMDVFSYNRGQIHERADLDAGSEFVSDDGSAYTSSDEELSSNYDARKSDISIQRIVHPKISSFTSYRRIRKPKISRAVKYRCLNCDNVISKEELQRSMIIVQDQGDEVIIICCPGSSSDLCPPIDAALASNRQKPQYSTIIPSNGASAVQAESCRKRSLEESMESIPVQTSKRRRISKSGELYHQVTLVNNSTKPDEQLLRSVKDLLNTKSKSQKELAREIKVSQTKLSQYLNRAYRTKGWMSLEEKLQKWIQKNIEARGILPASEADLPPIVEVSLPQYSRIPQQQIYLRQNSFTPANPQDFFQPLNEIHSHPHDSSSTTSHYETDPNTSFDNFESCSSGVRLENNDWGLYSF